MARGRSLWFRFVQWLARIGFGLLGGVRRVHRERIPLEGPLLVAPLHLSTLDPPLVGCDFPRMLHFMAKEELFKGIFGKLIASVGAFPVRRGANDTSAVRRAIETLEAGSAVLVFPEGTRGDAQRLGTIQLGLAMLAKRSGAMVLPIGIAGTERVLGKGMKKPKRARMTVVYGEPFTYTDVQVEGNDKATRRAFIDELSRRLVAATHEAGLEITTSGKSAHQTGRDPADTATEG